MMRIIVANIVRQGTKYNHPISPKEISVDLRTMKHKKYIYYGASLEDLLFISTPTH